MMLLSQVCGAVRGDQRGGDVMLQNVSINTREDCAGRLFVALKGDNFDAHDYLEQAQQAGAAAVMIEQDLPTELPSVLVKDTHQALKDLAAWWRLQFAIPVLGITGSVGKTTVKEMLGAITSELGQGVVTQGNLNNEIGVPLTLMRLTAQDQYAVIEMGMNHAGEIGRLSAISRPTVAIVNNAAAAHLEGLGSIEAVAKAKGEIFSGLVQDGVAVINADDPFAPLWSDLVVDKKIITFGLKQPADVSATYQQVNGVLQIELKLKGALHDEGVTRLRLNSLGEHSVLNALAAAATALAANIPLDSIVRGLENYQPIKGRLNPIQLPNLMLFDDTYNANPASMQAAIRVLSGYDNNLLLVGDMAELGDACEAEHLALGEFAATHSIERLMACGEYAESVVRGFSAKNANGFCQAFGEQSDMVAALTELAAVPAAILVKGSRSARMENVVEAIRQHYHVNPESKNAGEVH